jgi:hypothetical protein
MRIYTAHIHTRKPPVLVREGFSWGAFIFGPLFLLWHGAWSAGLIALAVLVVICTVAPPPLRPLLAFALFVVLGLTGQDLRRWSLSLGRFQLAHVVAARNRDEAFLRLLANRTDLIGLSA